MNEIILTEAVLALEHLFNFASLLLLIKAIADELGTLSGRTLLLSLLSFLLRLHLSRAKREVLLVKGHIMLNLLILPFGATGLVS